MNLIPNRNLVIHSALSENVLTIRLHENIETDSGFRFVNNKKSSKPFVGKFKERNFAIRPIFEGFNSLVPYVIGEIESGNDGTRVMINVRLNYTVTVLLTFIICLMIYIIIKYQEFYGIIFILFIYIMTILSFNVEYLKIKKTLKILFEVGDEKI